MTALDRTRGPWTVALGANVHPYVVVGPDENHVAGTYTTKRTRAECEANARLIASAPDMLAELRRDLRLAQEVVTFLAAYSDEAGRGFRFEAGRHSEAKPATVPI